MNTATAEVLPPPAPLVAAVSTLRAFDIPDLDRHHAWLFPRLRQSYPHMNDRMMIGWLRSVCYSAEFKFMYQDHAVGLFQCMSSHTLEPNPIVYERFVFVDDQENKDVLKQAAEFYAEVKKWGTHQNAAAIIVEQMTDVPHEMIRERMGRLVNRQEWFYKL